MTIEELIIKAVKKGTAESFTLENAEEIAFSRFENRLLSVDHAAIVIGVHPDTIRSYIKYNNLPVEPRLTNTSPYKIKMSDALKFRKI